jgi:hypothetical protein
VSKRDRSNNSTKRRENVREERKTVETRDLITFSLKDLVQDQPKQNTQTVLLWQQKGLLGSLLTRLSELSKLTREEACKQQQIKIYGNFPPSDKTDFEHPKHVDKDVAWSVIEGIGGKPRVAGYVVESTFYIVFLDSEHVFWKSELKHT